MKNYGTTRSTIKPEEKVIDDYSVWIASDITEVTVTMDGDTHTEYEYDLTQYSKDEYISLMDEKNVDLQTQINNTQIALCDIYEALT